MIAQETLTKFLGGIEKDPRIRITHIAVYIILFHQWIDGGCAKSIEIVSAEMMEKSKISSTATYHRVIRALHEYGYIRYFPSYNNKKKSKVSLE